MSVENIINIYNLSTPAEHRHGVTWYRVALTECERLAVQFDLPVNIVAGVVSALSPNNKWERNIENAHVLIDAYLDGEDINSVKVSTYNAMKNKAWQILNAKLLGNCHDDVVSDYHITYKLNGQKIVSFFECIMGYDTCCIDGHAKGIFEGQRFGLTSSKNYISKKYYKELQEAYVEAGKRCTFQKRHLKGFEIQAITWLTWKRIHGI